MWRAADLTKKCAKSSAQEARQAVSRVLVEKQVSYVQLWGESSFNPMKFKLKIKKLRWQVLIGRGVVLL